MDNCEKLQIFSARLVEFTEAYPIQSCIGVSDLQSSMEADLSESCASQRSKLRAQRCQARLSWSHPMNISVQYCTIMYNFLTYSELSERGIDSVLCFLRCCGVWHGKGMVHGGTAGWMFPPTFSLGRAVAVEAQLGLPSEFGTSNWLNG